MWWKVQDYKCMWLPHMVGSISNSTSWVKALRSYNNDASSHLKKFPFKRAKLIWTNRRIPGYCLSTPHRSSLSIQLPQTHSSHPPVWACWMRGKPPLQAYHDGMHDKVILPCWPGVIYSLPKTVHVGDTRPTWWSKGRPGIQCIFLQSPWMPFQYCVLTRLGANCNQNHQGSSQGMFQTELTSTEMMYQENSPTEMQQKEELKSLHVQYAFDHNPVVVEM